VYTTLLNLSEAHQRVDVVTVAWEVTRTSRAHGLGPLPTVLRAAVDASSIRDPAHALGAVAADQLRATATRAADALRADAAHPGLDLCDLFGTTRLLTDTVRVAATRLDTHHGRVSTIVDQDPMAVSPAHLRVVSR